MQFQSILDDMDSSSASASASASAYSSQSHPQNWLAFSLSNHFPSSTSPPSIHPEPDLSLVQPFHSSGATTREVAAVATNFTGVLRFEDFLGGGSTITTTTPTAPQFTQFSADCILTLSDAYVYDSELKSLAASFHRGYTSTQQPQVQKPFPAPSATELKPADSPKKNTDTLGQRTSIYRGVTRHRWTGRYEAHLWDNSCRREGQIRKGRQVYLGGYDKEEKAATAFDLAALKYWGTTTITNFPITDYENELEDMKNMTRQEFVASLRRKSSGFSRGASIYRGVTRHHQHGRWQARIGRVAGNKDLYLGTFSTQEEAAEAYDIAAIKFRGLNAVTNFEMSRYDVKSIANSNLPIGGLSNKSRTTLDAAAVSDSTKIQECNRSDERDNLSSFSSLTFASSQPSRSTLSFAVPVKPDPSDYWSLLGYQNPSPLNCAKNSSSFAQTLSMEYQATASIGSGSESNHDNGFSSGFSMLSHQQTRSDTSSPIQFAAPITTIRSSNVSSSYEGSSSGYGNWISPTFQTLQAHAKPSLYQTPIFGME